MHWRPPELELAFLMAKDIFAKTAPNYCFAARPMQHFQALISQGETGFC
jgi:hypothetical protein